MDEHEEHRDVVTEAENFLLIFAAVCFVTWFIKQLYRPFANRGIVGFFLGFMAITPLVFAIFLDGLSFAQSSTVYVLDSVTVKSPIANMRYEPKLGNNIWGTAKKGEHFSLVDPCGPNWIRVEKNGIQRYMHVSTLEVKNKPIVFRAEIMDFFLAITIAFYLFCLWGARSLKSTVVVC